MVVMEVVDLMVGFRMVDMDGLEDVGVVVDWIVGSGMMDGMVRCMYEYVWWNKDNLRC